MEDKKSLKEKLKAHLPHKKGAEKKQTGTEDTGFTIRLARFIIEKRAWIESVFIAGCIFCAVAMLFVNVNYDLTKYVPSTAQSSMGLDVMKKEFGYPGTARLMLKDVSLYEAKQYKDKIQAIDGVDQVLWCDTTVNVYAGEDFINMDEIKDYYKDRCAVMDITFEEESDSPKTETAIDEMKAITGDKGCYVGMAVQNKSLIQTTHEEMNKILVVAVIMIFVVLCLATTAWTEPILFLLVMGVAVLLNKGTNIFIGTISFLTDNVAIILQLATSMDYSIFLLDAYMNWRDTGLSEEEAIVKAVEEAINSIFASSLTTVVGFLALVTMKFNIGFDMGLVLAKDRKAYGEEMLAGLRESMFCVICVAFFMAGLLSSLLKTSGLIQALIWVVAELHVNTGFIPVVAFLICVVISTACGTSTGTVTAVSAVMCPLAGELGIDMGLMCGAVVSGSIFGDNLAPISDTTIASSQTQFVTVQEAVRTRLPYSMTVGIISGILYIVIGLSQSAGGRAVIEADPSSAKSLVFLLVPVVLVLLMYKGWGLVSALLLSNVLVIFFSLVLGVLDPAVLFSDDSPIASGMGSMANVAIVSCLIVMMIQIPTKSGAMDAFASWIITKCRTIRSAELIAYFMAIFGVVATHSSTNTIIFTGPFVRTLMDDYKDEADHSRSANILDATACGTNGLIPHGNPALVITGVATGVAGVPATFSFLDFLPYNFHCWGLLIIFFLSIMTGIGRKRRKTA